MPTSPDWKTKKGDTSKALIFDLRDRVGLIDLGAPGITARFQMRYPGGQTKVDAEATIDPDQTTNRGRVSYQPTAADMDTPGTFQGEFKITWPGDPVRVATFPNGERYIEIEIGAGVDDLPA